MIQIDKGLLEKITADFIDEDALVVADYEISRMQLGHRRFYVRDVGAKRIIAPSVTTLLGAVVPKGDYLADWKANLGIREAARYLTLSSVYGTLMHELYGELLLQHEIVDVKGRMRSACEKEDVDFRDFMAWTEEAGKDMHKDIMSFIGWVKRYDVETLALEYPIFHPEGWYAGSADLICNITVPVAPRSRKEVRVVGLVDFKSSKAHYDSQALQLTLYAKGWNAVNEPKIERIFNFSPKGFHLPYADSKKSWLFTDQSHKDINRLADDYVAMYHKLFKLPDFHYQMIENPKFSLEMDMGAIVKTSNFNEVEVEDEQSKK